MRKIDWWNRRLVAELRTELVRAQVRYDEMRTKILAAAQEREEKLKEQLEIKKRLGSQTGTSGSRSKRFERVLHEARGLNLSESGREFRDGELWHLAHDRRFAAFLALIEQVKGELEETTATYGETPERKTMAGGGAAALRELMDRLREIAEKPEEEEEGKK